MNLPASIPEDTRIMLDSELIEQIEALCTKYPENRRQSAVVPALWLAQKANQGWLPQGVLKAVADLLGMPPVRVQEVASFYTMFNLKPVGKWLVQVCGTTPCALRGANQLKDVCEQRIGSQKTIGSDGRLSWMEVECLGACVDAPIVQINDTFYENLNPESFNALLDDPDNWSPPEKERGAKDTLTDQSLYDGSRAQRLMQIPNAPEQDSKD